MKGVRIMNYSNFNWNYILLYISLGFSGGYLLDICISTLSIRMPCIFKFSKVNIFCSFLLPLIAGISIILKYSLLMKDLQILLVSFYLIALSLFIFFIFKSWGERKVRECNLIFIVFFILVSYKFF